MLLGCAPGGNKDNSSKLPTLADLRPRTRTRIDLSPATDEALFRVRSARVDVPLDSPLDELWLLVDQGIFDAQIALHLNRNGLKAGVLRAAAQREFWKKLFAKNVYRDTRAELTCANQLAPLWSAPPITEPQIVTVVSPPGEQTQIRFVRGRCQFLVRAAPGRFGRAWIHIVPHYNRPRPDLRPRSMLEKRLEGQRFDHLTMAVSLTKSESFIIGLYKPPDSQPVPPGVSDPDSVTQQAAKSQPSPTSGTPAPPPPRKRLLGDALMRRSVLRTELQSLLIINVQPEPKRPQVNVRH